MATLRELGDPLSNEIAGAEFQPIRVARQCAVTQIDSLLLKPALTPPEYAQAWALTHYLAKTHGDDFVKF
jgi:hypothetical protein